MSYCSDSLPCPSTYTRLALQRWPRAAAKVLRGSGLTSDDVVRQSTVTVAQQLQIFRNIRDHIGHKGWAIDIGRQFNINSHGPMGFAAISAPTLGEGIATLAEFARTRVPYVGFSLLEMDRRFLLRFDMQVYALGDLEVPVLEALQQVALSYTLAILGPDNMDPTLLFTHASRGYATRYREAFGKRCQFACDFNGLALPVSLKPLPCPLHDEKTYRSSLSRCREALSAVLSESDVLARASHWLASHFEHIATNRQMTSLPRLEQLAGAWGVTPRTVIRQLAEKGTSFSDLRSGQQLEMARRMLDDASYTVSEVGFLLGYGDAANFGRAFKRLTGLSPSEYRRRTR